MVKSYDLNKHRHKHILCTLLESDKILLSFVAVINKRLINLCRFTFSSTQNISQEPPKGVIKNQAEKQKG